MHLPTLGWITRNALNDRIDRADEELAALRELKPSREMAISRAPAGRFTDNQLNSLIEAGAVALRDFRAIISRVNSAIAFSSVAG